jgi:predicted transcriptional regulator
MADTETFTDLQQLLSDVLRQHGDWMTRAQIAQAIDRPNRLNPHDVAMLDDLVEKGIIEVTKRKTGAVRTEYVYKAK